MNCGETLSSRLDLLITEILTVRETVDLNKTYLKAIYLMLFSSFTLIIRKMEEQLLQSENYTLLKQFSLIM